MSSPFAITAATNSVRLNESRRGEATFTVFNASGRPIRGRARLATEDPAAESWISLAGVSERDFSIAGTHQYTVRIAVPPDAPPGNPSFRLDMVGVENPDEEYTQGPSVTFQVPEAKPRKPFPWWILALAGGGLLVVLIIVLAVVLWPRSTIVPEVAGMTVTDASAALNDANLRVGEIDSEPTSGTDVGLVVRTDPEEGVEVRRGTRVTLVIAGSVADVATDTPTPSPTPSPTRTPTPTPTSSPTPTSTPTPTPTPTLPPSPRSVSIDDPAEGRRPDIRRLTIGYGGENVVITLLFDSPDDLSVAGDFVYLYGAQRHNVTFDRSSFQVRRDPGADGLFEETLYTGSVERTGNREIRMVIPAEHIPDIVGKRVWFYSMSSTDRTEDLRVE
jgi:hypothetical protein